MDFKNITNEDLDKFAAELEKVNFRKRVVIDKKAVKKLLTWLQKHVAGMDATDRKRQKAFDSMLKHIKSSIKVLSVSEWLHGKTCPVCNNFLLTTAEVKSDEGNLTYFYCLNCMRCYKSPLAEPKLEEIDYILLKK